MVVKHCSKRLLAAAAAATAALVTVPTARAQTIGVWAKGTNGNWSTTGASRWTNGVVPNAIGDTASIDQTQAAASSTTTVTISGGVTVGTISHFGTTTLTDRSWIIAANTGITLNQDGAGTGRATISNSMSA